VGKTYFSTYNNIHNHSHAFVHGKSRFLKHNGLLFGNLPADAFYRSDEKQFQRTRFASTTKLSLRPSLVRYVELRGE